MSEQDQGGSTAMSLDEFLGHSSRGGGGDTNFLRWTKKQPPAVNTWLHTRAPIVALWQHNWPRIVTRKDQQTGQERLEVWGGTWNCWEAEAILKRQYFREKDTGLRKAPPQVCPHCMLEELLRQLVDSRRLSWVAPIFRFDVGDPQTARVLHAGGLYNAYGKKDITQGEIEELNQARIYRTESWKENAMAKCNYVFRLVDNDDPAGGIQVTTETTGLGDKVKGAIRDRMTSMGSEAGNPMRSPYCIRWEHHPNEQQFDQKYRAVPMDRVQLTEQVRQLIVDDSPPDISHLTRPGNVATLRSVMEQRYCGPQGMIDWDAVFGPAEAAVQAAAPEESTSFDYGANANQPAGAPNQAQGAAPAQGGYPSGQAQGAPQGAASQPGGGGSPMTAAVQGAAAPSDEIVECDKCHKDMAATDDVCPHCGWNYAEPAPPQRRTRSQAAEQPQGQQRQAQSAQPAQQGQGAGQDPGNAGWGIDPQGEGDLPF